MQALGSSTFAGARVVVKARAAKTTVCSAIVARRTKASSASTSSWYGEDRPKVRPPAAAHSGHCARCVELA